MTEATRTSEGFPGRCSVCGKGIVVTWCDPLGDATCPHCGVLIYPTFQASSLSPDEEEALAQNGISVETDDEGEIQRIYLRGKQFNDRTLHNLVKLRSIHVIDIRLTEISELGAERLQKILPDSRIET